MLQYFRIGGYFMKKIVKPLLNWYHENKRDLPWRKTKDPYHIWISEIMLQQTRVDTVIPYYHRFVATLPTYHDLAKVEEEKLLKLWEGLGYYSRARNLKVAANQVLEKFDHFPNCYEDLIQLKGIGPYSAGAISSISSNEKRSAIDGNVLRVVSRVRNSDKDITLKSTFNEINDCLIEIMPKNSGDFNQALMELGATICTYQGYQCEKCPIKKYCGAYQNQTQSLIPVKNKKITRKIIKKTILIFVYEDEIAIEKNKTKTVLYDMWQFPNLDYHLSYEDVIKNYDTIHCFELNKRKHIFSHLEWHMCAFVVEVNHKNKEFSWKSILEINNEIALPNVYKRYYDDYIEYKSRRDYERN